jgi:hypothetical protein
MKSLKMFILGIINGAILSFFDLSLLLTDMKQFKKEFDISECQILT